MSRRLLVSPTDRTGVGVTLRDGTYDTLDEALAAVKELTEELTDDQRKGYSFTPIIHEGWRWKNLEAGPLGPVYGERDPMRR